VRHAPAVAQNFHRLAKPLDGNRSSGKKRERENDQKRQAERRCAARAAEHYTFLSELEDFSEAEDFSELEDFSEPEDFSELLPPPGLLSVFEAESEPEAEEPSFFASFACLSFPLLFPA
jgi:hypothetical protein